VLFKIAITGPESTGKSWLSEKLAMHYNTVFVPEYARTYIDRLSRPYRQHDILSIAKGQLESEKQYQQQAEKFLFCDTELIVTKIWSVHKYGECHPWILEKINTNRYDLFLLCNIDMPWQYDPQREHPDLRKHFFDWYKKELDSYGFDYVIVSGLENERTRNAIDAIENHPAINKKFQ